jgi:type I restriction-modification system DNA methylase subunit
MINKDNLHDLLPAIGFAKHGNTYSKDIGATVISVDFDKELISYPESQGLKVNSRQTCNLSANENFVVLECVHRLLEKGYKPEHIELEPVWRLGHGQKSGRADILVRDQQGIPLLIIECKTAGNEFSKAWKDTEADGGQLFSYIEQEKATRFVCLYASEFDENAGQVKVSQRIISVWDNPKILEDNPALPSFVTANNNKERFKVWKDTYQQEYTETGIFEDNIQPYQIGKNKYTLADDTKALDAIDIKGAYHRFRTILRKHNVSRRENAFEVLVNLFLCKIVDELEHPNDLKFYWKGIAYDNYFDLVDRLQSLYKTGMERFLGQDIVYISNEAIESAFWPVKKKRSAVKEEIKRLFRELKFYKGLDFEFIKVFNKAYFDKNAKILLEIIQMWQGLRLTTSAQNQFLGDMFEYFLDNGIKQSEGQFFTPVPICKFILSALPLEQLIAEHSEPIKAIDYACGSGHFLTEYALQLPPLLEAIKNQADPRPWHQQIVGIEKEDRLAKVAKVSSFMYGFQGIQILDADALQPHAQIKEGGYNLLVANPPFAVEDFLLTIPEEDRERFNLFNTVNDPGNKNVQCFFLERARQLLAGGGVMGVIVPSSILSNTDNMHVATREILLKYFDFVALTELGGNTFGKTGTNTVILFLRRKAQRPEPAQHYWNRVQDFFENWADEAKTGGGEYLDIEVVRAYCAQIGVDYDAYQTLLLGKPSDSLLTADIFKDYRRAFDTLAETKKLKINKKKTAGEKTAELATRFLQFCREKEQDKLYYFMLAHHNPTPVLIIKSPADNKEQQKFLGYEWSGAKGQEGIRYHGGNSVKEILTPLFDPNDRDHTEKLSYLVRRNFEGRPMDIPAALQAYASQARLTDLLDFGRVEFDKAIALNARTTTMVIASKWNLVKLEDVAEIQSGGTPDSNNPDYWDGDIFWATLVDTKEKYLHSTQRKITQLGLKNSNAKLLPVDTVIFSSRATIGEVTIAKVPVATNQGYKNFICDQAKIIPEFLYAILSRYSTDIAALAGGMTFKEVSKTAISNFKIPLPPLNIQQRIVTECGAVDQAVEQARKTIEQQLLAIAQALTSTGSEVATRKLGDICDMKAGKFVSAVEIKDKPESNLYPCYGGNGLRGYTKTFTHQGTYPLIGRQGALCGNVCMATGKFHATEHAVVVSPSAQLNVKWLYHKLIALNLNQYATGVAQPGLSVDRLKTVVIEAPSPTEQQTIATEIETLEAAITAAQAVVDGASAQKQAILQRYL